MIEAVLRNTIREEIAAHEAEKANRAVQDFGWSLADARERLGKPSQQPAAPRSGAETDSARSGPGLLETVPPAPVPRSLASAETAKSPPEFPALPPAPQDHPCVILAVSGDRVWRHDDSGWVQLQPSWPR